MAKQLSAEDPLLQIVFGTRHGSQQLFDALMSSAMLEILATAVDSSREYIELLTALSELQEVEASDIGVVEAQASHRKLVAVVDRLRRAGQGRCHD